MMVYDITLPISGTSPTWPGDPPVQIRRTSPPGEPVVSRINMNSHVGTHVDAPAHFVPSGRTIDQVSLDVLAGPAWMADLTGLASVTADALSAAGIPARTSRLLIRTANSAGDRRRFDPAFVALMPDAAEWLLAQNIRLLGVDGPSVDPYDASEGPVHRALLAADVVIVENLALASIPVGAYELVCLPLPITGGDGAPARVILRRCS